MMPDYSDPSDTVMAYGTALQAGDKETILTLYTEDAEIIPDQLPRLAGRAAISQFYDTTFATISIKGELQIVDIVEFDQVAIVRCEEPADVVDRSTGQSISSYFRELFVLKNVDGSWKILKYMFSQNPSQALQSRPR